MTNYHLAGTLRGTNLPELWITNGLFCETRPEGPVTEVTGFVYPGLVDAHTHPGLSHTAETVDDSEVLRRLAMLRAQGVTVVREMGAQRDVGHLAALGRTKVIRSGRHLARTKRYLRYLPIDVEPMDLPAAAAEQAARSDGWVKIVGDWIDRSDGAGSDLQPLWPREALVDAFAAVHELGCKVAVHTFATDTIDHLLEAGVDSIEHGTGMTRDHLIEARERGILIDPTMRQISTFEKIALQAVRYPVYQEHMMAMHARRAEQLRLMIEVGSHIIMGSDTAEDLAERGLPSELHHCVAAGMSPQAAMASASYEGRRLLGLPAWQIGAPGDVVVYNTDPELNIDVTWKPDLVLIDGKPAE